MVMVVLAIMVHDYSYGDGDNVDQSYNNNGKYCYENDDSDNYYIHKIHHWITKLLLLNWNIVVVNLQVWSEPPFVETEYPTSWNNSNYHYRVTHTRIMLKRFLSNINQSLLNILYYNCCNFY